MDYLIWSYEHNAWWGPARCGYTPDRVAAGRYDLAAAVQIVTTANLITINETMIPVEEAATFQPSPSIACPRCRRRSFHPRDIAERYCGACHRFHEDL